MKRRTFIRFTAISTFMFFSTNSIARVFNQKNLTTLEEIYEIVFPKTENMPSAKEFGALNYLVANISHKTFDNEDKEFITTAIKDFQNSFPEFLDLSKQQKKELIFSAINESYYAKRFVSKLTYYGIEAMFSDPIYGGNTNQIVWKSVNHYYGKPRPKFTYGQKL